MSVQSERADERNRVAPAPEKVDDQRHDTFEVHALAVIIWVVRRARRIALSV
jgi:hypothetical protein